MGVLATQTAMSRSDFSIRVLRALAMQRLGALAAQLKTRDELYDALAELAPDALGLPPPAKPAEKGAKAPAAEPPRPVKVKKAAKTPPTPAPARGKKKEKEPAKAKASPPAPEITSPQRLPAKNKVADRQVVRDFFVPPGSRALPAAFGDDRVMLFPRDPRGVFVSWDLSPRTFGQGGLRLVLRTHDGLEVWAQDIHSPQGSVSIAGDFGGASLRAVIGRGGDSLKASPAVLMPGSDVAWAERWKVRVDPVAQLPQSPQRVGLSYGPAEAPAGAGPTSPTPGAAPSRLG
jgi:hypothetical protein